MLRLGQEEGGQQWRSNSGTDGPTTEGRPLIGLTRGVKPEKVILVEMTEKLNQVEKVSNKCQSSVHLKKQLSPPTTH